MPLAEPDNMADGTANLCAGIIKAINDWLRDVSDAPEHVSVSYEFGGCVDVSFDVYITKRVETSSSQ